MVHHQILPFPQRHLDDRECYRSAQGAPPGIGAPDGGGLKHQPGQAIGISEGGGDCSSTDESGFRRHAGPLPPAKASMVPGREDVEHGLVGEGGAVPDGIHPGDVSSSLQERDHTGPTA